MSGTLTAEQKARIEANKAQAIARRQASLAKQSAQPIRPSITTSTFQSTNRLPQPSGSSGFNSGSSYQPRSFFSSNQNNYRQFRPSGSGFGNATNTSNSGWNRTGNGPRFTQPHFQRGSAGDGHINAVFPTSSIQVDLTILDRDNFRVEPRKYCQEVNDLCKMNPKKTYDPVKKCFYFPWSEYEMIKNGLKNIRSPGIRLYEPFPHILEMFQKPKNQVKQDLNSLCRLKNIFWDKLFDYQKESITKGIEFNGRILIADEMGLGKTVQALALAYYYQEEWPLLIITPASMKESWKQSIEKFLPNNIEVFTTFKRNTKNVKEVFILSYDSLASKINAIVEDNFHVIIFDESHMLKDRTARRTKAAIDISRSCSRVILCSGTPAVKGPIELFTQVKMINNKLFPNYNDYAFAYCDAKDGYNGHLDVKGASRCDELSTILNEFVMIRRTKKDVEQSLPPKTRHFLYLDAKRIHDEMSLLDVAKKKFMVRQNHDNMMEFFRATAAVKASPVSRYIENEYITKNEIKDKIIIFGHHQVILDTIGRMLEINSIKYMRIDGTTQNRQKLVDDFQQKDNLRVALLSIGAAGTGLTLTAANIVIFAELYWNPSNLMQAEDRAHRIGQLKPVKIYYLLARNTVDDYVLMTLKRKMKNLDAISLNTGSFTDVTSSVENTSKKISDYFDKILDSNNKPQITINSKTTSNDPIVIDENDDFNDDDIFKAVPKKNKTENDVITIDDDSWDEEKDIITEESKLKRKSARENEVDAKKFK